MEAWHQHYHEQGYEEIDGTLNYVSKGMLPVYWNLSEQLKQATTEKERKMREDSIAYGVIRNFYPDPCFRW